MIKNSCNESQSLKQMHILLHKNKIFQQNKQQTEDFSVSASDGMMRFNGQ